MSAHRGTDCTCDHESLRCRCGHPVSRHVITSDGALVCPVHGRMGQCTDCRCTRFRWAEAEDPRDFGITAAGLRAAADRLYAPDDQRLNRLDWTHQTQERYGQLRSRLRALADAMEETSQP